MFCFLRVRLINWLVVSDTAVATHMTCSVTRATDKLPAEVKFNALGMFDEFFTFSILFCKFIIHLENLLHSRAVALLNVMPHLN